MKVFQVLPKYGLSKETSKTRQSATSSGWEQIAKLSKKATLKFINTALLIAQTIVTSTIMKLGN